MKYKRIIFDFDGTLADSFPFFARVINVLADKHGFARLSDEDLEALRGASAAEMIKRTGLPMGKIPIVAWDFRRLMAGAIGEIPLFPGVGPTLQRLAEGGAALGMLTSNAEENVQGVLGPANTDRFAAWECRVSMFGKPARLRRLLRRMTPLDSPAIYIGDELRDIEAAREAGAAAGAAAWGYATAEALAAKQPDEMFHSLPEIPERLA